MKRGRRLSVVGWRGGRERGGESVNRQVVRQMGTRNENSDTFVSLHAYVHVSMCICIFLLCMCTHVYTCVCMCVCMRVCDCNCLNDDRALQNWDGTKPESEL